MKKESDIVMNAEFDKVVNKEIIKTIGCMVLEDYNLLKKQNQSFEEYVTETFVKTVPTLLEKKEETITDKENAVNLSEFTLSVTLLYIVLFSEKFDIEDMLKTIQSRRHWFNDCDLSLEQLAYKMLNSVINKEFSAQLMLRFAYKGMLGV